jgi:LPS export ABC transporter protein LptC
MTNRIENIRSFIITALITGCFFAGGCENDINQVKDLGKKVAAIEEGKEIEILISQQGKLGAKLTAPTILRYQGDSSQRTIFPNTLHVDFYNDSLKVESQLNARYGRFLPNESKVYLRDSVIIFNMKGDTLYSDEMYWDQNLGQFYTQTPVTLIQNYPYKQKGKYLNGFRSNQDLTNITFYKVAPGSFIILPDSTIDQ